MAGGYSYLEHCSFILRLFVVWSGSNDVHAVHTINRDVRDVHTTGGAVSCSIYCTTCFCHVCLPSENRCYMHTADRLYIHTRTHIYINVNGTYFSKSSIYYYSPCHLRLCAAWSSTLITPKISWKKNCHVCLRSNNRYMRSTKKGNSIAPSDVTRVYIVSWSWYTRYTYQYFLCLIS